MARPRQFEMDQAIENAMQAFWDHGYEATSMADLMKAMDLQKGSIYKAFGDKHTLFIATLEHYLDDYSQTTIQLIESEDSPKKGIYVWLETVLADAYKQKLRRGCMVVNTLNERAHFDDQAAIIIEASLSKLSTFIAQKIKKGQALGEFRKDMNPDDIAQLLLVALTGTWSLSKGPMTKAVGIQNIKNIFKLLEA